MVYQRIDFNRKNGADFIMILLGDEDIAASSLYSMVDLVALAVSGYYLLMGSFDFINKPLSKNWRHFYIGHRLVLCRHISGYAADLVFYYRLFLWPLVFFIQD